MSTATQNLENDHVEILRLIDVMAQMVHQTEILPRDLEEVVEIIRNFADGLHHAKEELLLFPLMAEKGFSMQTGPIAVMLMEHEQGRGFVRGMQDNIELYKNGESEALKRVYSFMTGYAELLTNHIAKENNILFRMADNAFDKENQQYLLEQFTNIDAGTGSKESSPQFAARINLLANKYLKTNN